MLTLTPMPNQRKKGNKQATLWLTPVEKSVLKKLAAQSGMTVSAYLKKEVTQYIEKHEPKQ